MSEAQLRLAKVELEQIQIAGIGVGLSTGSEHTTIIAPGDHPDQPTMNPTAIKFDRSMVAVNGTAVAVLPFAIVPIPFLDPMHPENGLFVNLQFGLPDMMQVIAVTIEDFERVIGSLSSTLELAKLEQKARGGG